MTEQDAIQEEEFNLGRSITPLGFQEHSFGGKTVSTFFYATQWQHDGLSGVTHRMKVYINGEPAMGCIVDW